MQAEPADQQKLLELQEHDNELAQIAAKRRQLPEIEAVSALETALAESKNTQREQLAVVDELRAELSRAESDVELVEARIQRDSDRLTQVTSPKDAQGLEHELATLRERLGLLEEVELGVMERLEAAEAELQGTEQATSELQSRLDEAVATRDNALDALTADQGRVQFERDAIAASIPADLLALYEKQRERYGVGASLLQRGISRASGVKLTESDLQAIRNTPADEVVLCPDSNAILVRTAESGI